MPHESHLVSRHTPGEPEMPFEMVKFNDVQHPNGGRGDWLSHVLLEYVPHAEFNQMVEAPEWNPESMKITILLNDIRITHATFESMVSEFSGQMLNHRIKRGRWGSFEDAVKLKAGQLMREAIGTLQDNAYALAENLGQLADSSSTIIDSVRNAPFMNHVDDAMKRAGSNAVELFGAVEPNEAHRAQLAERVFRAMNYAKPKHLASSVKVTLPAVTPAVPEESPPASREAGLIAQGRQQMLDEVMAALDAQGILFHRDAVQTEESGS